MRNLGRIEANARVCFCSAIESCMPIMVPSDSASHAQDASLPVKFWHPWRLNSREQTTWLSIDLSMKVVLSSGSRLSDALDCRVVGGVRLAAD